MASKSDNHKSDCSVCGSDQELAISSIDSKDRVKTEDPGSPLQCIATADAIKQDDTNETYYPRPQPQLTRLSVQVCPINVGQGDSILLKLQYEQGMLCNS